MPFAPFLTLVYLLLMAAALTACGDSPEPPRASTDKAPVWRTFVNADGSVTPIPARPQRILSTSVTVTGTLLAIDVPVVASAAAADGRFFGQWQAIARERQVARLWSAGAPDLEAVLTVAPDLIVVSVSGADSVGHLLPDLRAIAPTILVDYGNQSWQALASRLAQATGLERQTEQLIEAFNQRLEAAKARLVRPAGQVNIISYNGPGMSNPVATADGVHGRLLTALGFEVEEPDPTWHSPGMGDATDFVRAQYEHLTRLTAPTTFLTRVDDRGVSDFLHDPVLANLPSVRSGQVYGLGVHSFRIDYFSSLEIIDGMLARFGR